MKLSVGWKAAFSGDARTPVTDASAGEAMCIERRVTSAGTRSRTAENTARNPTWMRIPYPMVAQSTAKVATEAADIARNVLG